jgi:hypothetical protein
MAATRQSIASRPIGPDDFDEFGDSFWIWALVPILMALYDAVSSLILNGMGGGYYGDVDAIVVVFRVIDLVLTSLLLIFVWLAVSRRPRPRDDFNTGAAIGGVILVGVIGMLVRLVSINAYRFPGLLSGEYRFDLFAGFANIGAELPLLLDISGNPVGVVSLPLMVASLLLYEIIFRGAIMGGLLQNGASPGSALAAGIALPMIVAAISAIFQTATMAIEAMSYFGDFRFENLIGIVVSLLGTLVMATMLSWLRIASGRLWPCIVATLASIPVYLFGYGFFVPGW